MKEESAFIILSVERDEALGKTVYTQGSANVFTAEEPADAEALIGKLLTEAQAEKFIEGGEICEVDAENAEKYFGGEAGRLMFRAGSGILRTK